MPCFNTCFRPESKIAPLSCHSPIRYWMSNMASDAKASLSSKNEYRAVTRYLYLKNKVRKYTASWPMFMGRMHKLNSGLGDSNPVEEETRSGRPSDATDEEMCNKVRDLVYSDRQVKVEKIVNALHISHGSVSTILHDRLGMRKLKARWVPKSLSNEQMATRASVCRALLKRFRSKKDNFLSRLVTVNETWVHYYEPENKAQSCQWIGPGSPRPKKNQNVVTAIDLPVLSCGWSGVVRVSCILCQQAYSWARPAILVAGKSRGEMLLFVLFLHVLSCSSFFPVPLFHLLYYLLYLFSPFL